MISNPFTIITDQDEIKLASMLYWNPFVAWVWNNKRIWHIWNEADWLNSLVDWKAGPKKQSDEAQIVYRLLCKRQNWQIEKNKYEKTVRWSPDSLQTVIQAT